MAAAGSHVHTAWFQSDVVDLSMQDAFEMGVSASASSEGKECYCAVIIVFGYGLKTYRH